MSSNHEDPELPRHADHDPGAEVKVERRDDGGVTVDFSDGSDGLEVSRREFMRLSGVAAASATMASASCRYPKENIVPYLDRPDDIESGQWAEYATVCNGCSAQCGVLARTRSGRPIKLEGNPDHPVNEGSLCARGESSYRRLYDPDRQQQPCRIHKDGGHVEIDWNELDDEVVRKLSEAAAGGSVRLLTRSRPGSARDRLFEEITESLPDAEHYVWEPLTSEALARASETSYGDRHVPIYHFERAEVVVSLGSDFLGTWIAPPEFTKKFSRQRQIDDEKPEKSHLNRFIAFEGTMTTTGSNADEHHTVRTSHLVYVALGLAHVVLHEEGYGPLAGDERALSAVEPFTPEAVAEKTGVDAARLQAYGRELVDNAGQGLVLAGAASSNAPNGVSLESAVNLLNRALENEGETVERGRTSRQDEGSFADLRALAEEMQNGEVDVLIVDRANPVYAAPPDLEFASALDNVSLVVSTSDRVDETARHADLLATGSHYLEAWGDSNPKGGVHSIQQPTIQPLYDTRSLEESLLVWFGRAGLVRRFQQFLQEPEPPSDQQGDGNTVKSRGRNVPYDAGVWYRYLRAHWKNEVFPTAGAPVDFDTFWEDVLRQGVWERDVETPEPSFALGPTLAALPDGLPEQGAGGSPGDLSSKELQGVATVGLYDGRTANTGHLQEMPDPVTKHTWGSYVMVSPRTLAEAELEQGEVLELTVQGGDGEPKTSVEFPVIMQPGMHDDVIGVPLGYGREAAGVVGDGVGENAFELSRERNGLHAYAGIDVEISRTGATQEVSIVQGSQVIDLDERPIFGTTTLDSYEENPHSGIGAHEPETGLWDAHDYGKASEGGQNRGEMALKWGMSIDMTKCTGCSACVTACQEENNVPVVGKKGILEGREMHWMRIDRYFILPKSGENEAYDELRHDIDDDPMMGHDPSVDFAREFPDMMADLQVSNQPMLCQHCERAPCETVCPVSATTHSTDGLNQMVYNRCVGTRYCSNNCPYKVRRFNWFNYSRDRSGTIFSRITPELEEHSRLNVEEPLPLGLNPDVTVRSRGVMEKCTFCVQRIRRAKWQLREEDRDEFREDDVVTACEQACPADAIEFGNIHESSDHTVRADHESERATAALSHLNTAPSIAYLSDIRNTDHLPSGHGTGGHGGGHGADSHGSGGHSGEQTGGAHQKEGDHGSDSHGGGEDDH